MKPIIDLRSDTITRPGVEMRAAMAAAAVGDDVYDDDPTVNELQERCAVLVGKEAALFMPSGTMSNAVAIKCHTKHGDEILLDGEAHSMVYELGLPGAIAGVLTRQFPSKGGIPIPEKMLDCIHVESLHNPGTRLIVLENTHNRAGGAIIPLEIHNEIRRIADEHDLRIHLDGARLFNAAVASGVPAASFAACADSVTFCLSKGLGCPVGSMLCGSSSFITMAKRYRKMLGGGMRQIGILAAAGIYALNNNIDRLAIDHANARLLAATLEGADGITTDADPPPTNMVYINTRRSAAQVCADLAQNHNVLCNYTAAHRLRFVTHMDVNESNIYMAALAIKEEASKA